MQLIEDWDAVLKKAWSIKFSILAAIFGAAEFVVQQIKPAGIPDGIFSGIGAVTSLLAGAFRLLQQQELSGGGDASSQK